ncbi:Alkaline phosphatase [Mucinivorans hirudinis]|uniref:Alkaline phosphatase n=1 Tax=Mucinivorans hirudinis TaxID=1433126 RepID=A0A060R650_9BACT|nr:Alkaline phosphatase [Mucinivorans hirudinis]
MMKKIITIVIAFFTVIAVQGAKTPKYVFLFIGDGMGFTQVALAEAALAARDGKIGFEKLNFTQFPYSGMVTTQAANRLTTCSAAAGTALATGNKTSINTISMNADRTQKMETIAEKVKARGYKVGVVTSVSIDHATPAAFYAHEPDRNMYYEIAGWMPTTGFDLYAGAGMLKPKGEKNRYDELLAGGYEIMKGLGTDLKGAKMYWEQAEGKNPANLPLAIDSKEDDLTLTDMTERAINFLMNKRGFFIMIEGGQIDWAAHANDAASIVHEVKDMDNAIAKALEFYHRYPNETLIIVTADHETGGLTLGLNSMGYDTNLSLLFSQKSSRAELVTLLEQCEDWQAARKVLTDYMGFWNSVKVSSRDELELLVAFEKSKKNCANAAVDMLASKAGVGFTTGSHTPAYVPVFAIGVGAERFSGKIDNTDIPRKIDTLMKP